MTVRTNQAMLDLLGGDPEFLEPNSVRVPDKLISQLAAGFKEFNGCVVPSGFDLDQQGWTEHLRRDLDETGFECLLSKTYLQDFFTRDISLSELCRVGLAYGFYLRKAICESQVFGQFRFIVDAQLPDLNESQEHACSVRFHKLRPDQQWLVEDLESYKHNAILVMDWVNSASRN